MDKVNKVSLRTHTIVMMVGPSECGKSYWANQQKELLEAKYGINVPVLSSDENRRKILGVDAHKHDPIMMTVSKGAFDMLYHELEILTSWPVNKPIVFIDATHLSKESRDPIINIAKKNNYNLHAVVFKYNKYQDFMSHVTGEKWIVKKHIEKFKRETLSTLWNIKSKTMITSKEEVHEVELCDLEEFRSHFIDKSNVTIIGDIHGEIEKLREAVEFSGNQESHFVLVGDIVDKNTEEKIIETINYVYDLWKEGRLSLVKGNHDFAVYSWLIQNGRYTEDIIRQYFDSAFYITGETKDKFIELIKGSKNFLIDGQRRFIVSHAPCEAKYLGKLDGYSTKSQRSFRYPKKEDGMSREEHSRAVFEALAEVETDEYGYPLHIFGHIAFNGIVSRKSFVGIDTGACYGSRLSTVSFGENKKRFFKSFGDFNDHEDLVLVEDKVKDYNLYDFDPKTRGRIFHTARNGLPFTSSTICPADKDENELESLNWALDQFENPILQVKHMGSWSVIRLTQDPKTCRTYSRNGYLVKKEGLENAYQTLIDKLHWDHGQREYVIVAELMPWRFLGNDLIDRDFYGLGFLVDQEYNGLKETGFIDALKKLSLLDVSGDKEEVLKKQGHHVWDTHQNFLKISKEQYDQVDQNISDNQKFLTQVDLYGKDCEPYFEPFLFCKVVFDDGKEERFEDDNELVYTMGLNTNPYHFVDKKDPEYREKARAFFDSLTMEQGHEGVVVKNIVNIPNQIPFIKVRSPEYLRITYGYDYQRYLEYHKAKKYIKSKLLESAKDWTRSKKLLDIPLESIGEDNKEVINLIADFVAGESKVSSLDPRL